MLPPDGWTSTSEPSLTVGRRGSINNYRDHSLFRIVRCNRCGRRSGPEEHSSFCSIQVQRRYNSNSILIVIRFLLLRCVKDIPDEFLKKQFSIFGEVVHAGLGQGGEGKLVPVVGLRHQPILARRAGASSASLPCVIRGVAIEPDLKSQAKQAIESEVIGKKVKVTLLDTDGEEVGVRLRLKAWGVWRICLAEKLVGLGLGKTLPAHSLPPLFKSALEKQERRARRKRLGLWKEEKRRGMLSWLTDPLKTKISSIFQRKV